MNLLWISAGSLLGLLNIGTQYWVVQKLNPQRNSVPQVTLALSSGAIRILFTAWMLLYAFRDRALSGILCLASFLIVRWCVLFIVNRS